MNKTPKLRFKEFSGGWKTKKLGDLGDVTKLAGFEFTKHVEYSDTGEIIALRGLNVKNGKLVLNDIKYIDNSDFSKLNRSKLFIDDLLFTYVGTVGETAIIDKNDKYYLAPNVSRIRFDLIKSNSKFMHYNISRSEYFNKIIQPSIATSSQPALSMENIRKLNINVPLVEEQEKIASFFSLIDDKISLQGDKVEALKDYKKGMMQKIFSRKLRFKNDDGRDYPEWEEKKLGEITSLVKDGSHGTHVDVKDGPYLLSAKNIKDGKIIITDNERRISYDEYNKIYNNYKLKEGDILLSIVGTIGRLAIAPKVDNIAFQRSVAILRFNDINEHYIIQFMNTNQFQNELVTRQVISAQPGIYLNDLKKMKIIVPCIEEQKKIADLLGNLDEKINKEQEKLNSLNEYKRGLLQQMFV